MIDALTYPFLAKWFASSTISPDVLSPAANPPPCTHTMAARRVMRSVAGGRYTSSLSVTVWFDAFTALPYVMPEVVTTVVKIWSR